MRFKRECETDFAPKIVSSEHPQPGHQQMRAKNGANTVPVPSGRLNVCGFKRDRSTFHQSEEEVFQEMHAGAFVDVTTAGRYPPPEGTRDHAYRRLSTAFGIIHSLPRGRSIILPMTPLCGEVGCAVPGRGLEPLRIAPPDPKSGASANFATLASLILRNLCLYMYN